MKAIDNLKVKIFLSLLKKCKKGNLTITTPDNEIIEIKKTQDVFADINIKNWEIVDNMMKYGDVGFASDYKKGNWSTSNLKDLFTFVLINDEDLKKLLFGESLVRFFSNLKYVFNKNTLSGSKKNIETHYDLGNDFYQIWLDKSLTYSSALFENNNQDLYSAQINKYSRINNILNSGNNRNLLEIGTGWGGFLNFAKNSYEKLDSITISKRQFEFAKNMHKDNGNIQIIYDDYRNVSKKYESIVSIEMFEAVGSEYWNTFFQKINSLLINKGKAVIQTITIDDKLFDSYKKGTDAIRTFIFPGGMLPSQEIFIKYAKNNGFKVVDKFSFGDSYSKTLDIWHKNFKSNIETISRLGFDEKFLRLWEYYLASCSSGFINNRTNVYQFVLQKT